MSFKLIEDFEAKCINNEYKRLLKLGYDESDADEIARSSIDTKMTNLLLLLLLKQGEKK